MMNDVHYEPINIGSRILNGQIIYGQ